jgi:hypothetical protein
MVSLREVYRRVFSGPLVTQKDFFSLDHFLHPLQALAKEYGITWDPNDYVPTDPGMADNLFQAGMAFLEEKGMWCMDTSRVVKFTKDEIKESWNKLSARGKVKVLLCHQRFQRISFSTRLLPLAYLPIALARALGFVLFRKSFIVLHIKCTLRP